MTKDELIDSIRRRLASVRTEPFGGARVESEYEQGVEQGCLFERRAISALLADYEEQESERVIARSERARLRSMRIRNERLQAIGARAVIPLAARGVVGMIRK